ncbi:hypothetical protein R1sor_027279 [Riccia sorocarpa]|uniref:Uncharacterized protein n=1 Tax=Riccia sorocarpa TaxID=122646 RepID=A0ABD3GF95_9MARC
MTVGLTKEGYSQLTSACRCFLWDKICRKKEDEGMGLVCFELQAKTLKMRMVTKLLEEDDLDWTRDTPTLAKILERWWAVRPLLKLKENALFPSDLRVDQALNLLADRMGLKGSEIKRFSTSCARAGMQYVGDINVEGLARVERTERQLGRNAQTGTAQGPLPKTLWVIDSKLRNNHSDLKNMADPSLWSWVKEGKMMEGLPFLLLFVCHARQAWRERCYKVFQGKRGCLPAAQVAREAADLASEIEKSCSPRAKETVKMAKAYLTELAERESRHQFLFHTTRHRLQHGERPSLSSLTCTSNFSDLDSSGPSSHSSTDSVSDVSGGVSLNDRPTRMRILASLDNLGLDLERLGFIST